MAKAKETVPPLRFYVDENTFDDNDDHDASSSNVKFYDSSVRHKESGDRLMSIITDGDGMRLTYPQAQELRDWLNNWLAKGPLGG